MTPARGAALVGAAAFASRLPFLPSIEQDLDGSRFVRAMLRFDLAREHPHPPGYPVFLALARIGWFATERSPPRALALVSAAGFGLTCALVFAMGHRATSSRLAACIGAATFALGTTATVHSTRPLSDMLGCALAWAALALSLRTSTRDRAGQGVLLGLLAGARPSALPLTLVGALRSGRVTIITAIAVALAVYAPVVWLTGPARFVALVLEHASGHFTRFGGSVVTRPDLSERLGAFAFGVQAHVLGGWWPDRAWWLLPSSIAAWSLIGLGVRRAREVNGARAVAVACAVYGAWALLGQNVVWQPRHLLPLAPGLALLVALGVHAARERSRWLALALVAGLAPMAIESLRLLRAEASERPPAVMITDEIARRCDPSRTLVATAQLATWIRYRAPEQRVVEVRDVDEALALARRNGLALCVTSEVPGLQARAGELTMVLHARGDRYVHTTLYDLALWMSAP